MPRDSGRRVHRELSEGPEPRARRVARAPGSRGEPPDVRATHGARAGRARHA